jgi:hypothetical protein
VISNSAPPLAPDIAVICRYDVQRPLSAYRPLRLGACIGLYLNGKLKAGRFALLMMINSIMIIGTLNCPTTVGRSGDI